jgi:hypothetical protein
MTVRCGKNNVQLNSLYFLIVKQATLTCFLCKVSRIIYILRCSYVCNKKKQNTELYNKLKKNFYLPIKA